MFPMQILSYNIHELYWEKYHHVTQLIYFSTTNRIKLKIMWKEQYQCLFSLKDIFSLDILDVYNEHGTVLYGKYCGGYILQPFNECSTIQMVITKRK